MKEKYFTKSDVKKLFEVETVSDICFSDLPEKQLKYYVLEGGGIKKMLY